MWITSDGSNTLQALEDATMTRQTMQTAGFLKIVYILGPLTLCAVRCLGAGSMYILNGKVTIIIVPSTKNGKWKPPSV